MYFIYVGNDGMPFWNSKIHVARASRIREGKGISYTAFCSRVYCAYDIPQSYIEQYRLLPSLIETINGIHYYCGYAVLLSTPLPYHLKKYGICKTCYKKMAHYATDSSKINLFDESTKFGPKSSLTRKLISVYDENPI